MKNNQNRQASSHLSMLGQLTKHNKKEQEELQLI
jgi:hypothetical protein